VLPLFRGSLDIELAPDAILAIEQVLGANADNEPAEHRGANIQLKMNQPLGFVDAL